MTKPSYEELLAELLRVRGLLQRQWISVEERLPDDYGQFLVFATWRDSDGDAVYRVTEASWNMEDGWSNFASPMAVPPTGWRELPDPPTSRESSSLVSQGAESADIGKLDTADKSGKVNRVPPVPPNSEMTVSPIVPNRTANSAEQGTTADKSVEYSSQNQRGSAETGGEKAAHLPNLSDHCDDCGHVRAKHGHGAIGYNAASNCTLDDCDCPWWLEPTFHRTSQNQTVSGGVEGAHEGTTADKSGSREPEKLNNAHNMDAESTELAEFALNEQVALAESSLSSPPPKSDSSAPTIPVPSSTQLDTDTEKI